MDVDGSGSICCDPNEIGGYHSSDEENGATRMGCCKGYAIQEGFELNRLKNDQSRKYVNILIKMNPGSMAKVHVNTDMVATCQVNIGGVLLSACVMDADNGIFPLAYCVVESENTESWSFFLQFLCKALQWNTQKAICFMIDRQNGVLEAIKNEWPTVGSRYCFQHISTNFNAKKEFSNLDINRPLWQAAKEGSEAGFKQVMEKIKVISVDA
ncbi:hypothetical protein EZV62_027541 [Acer yangbiense]|uniref:MULE transposase domain-containing protein n=1 Tax=Acer yangbiense TaxID=1000413 RepID=A0A5C7GUW9_9ROSI|nr:hypothetical protein EZV62_027541 [Acer yangbiense]